jgi:hypothetical protein
MDLTRLYNLTTPELRKEAERIGVNDTYAMSRGQLIHAIRNHAGGKQQASFLGKVVGFAKWALQAAQEEPLEDAPSEPPVSEALSGEAKTFSRPAEAESVPAAASEASVGVPLPVTRSARAAENVTESGDLIDNADVTENANDTGPPSRPPAGVFSKSTGMFEEPFPTRTMARILAEQGHFKRSLAIYAGLLRDAPGDRELNAEVSDVRVRSRVRRSQAH